MNRSNQQKIPPCPDPLHYTLVSTRTKTYWRLKRGTIKPATLNDTLRKNAELSRITGPAVKALRTVLAPHLEGLQCGHTWVKMSSLLSKHLVEYGCPGYGFFKGLDLQPLYPLKKLLLAHYVVGVTEQDVSICIPIDHHTIKKHNQLVTDYVFDAVMVTGDATQSGSLKVCSVQSELFTIGEGERRECRLEFELPQDAMWMVLLKLSCFEGSERAAHPRHYGLQFVASNR